MTDDRVDRLAQLQARRAATSSGTAPTSAAPVAAKQPSRRRSPAISAKVLTVGASASAVLGMMAGYGIAEGRADLSPSLVPATGDETSRAEPATAVPIPTTLAATTTPQPTMAPPQVIVVMIDGETGHRIDAADVAEETRRDDLPAAAPTTDDTSPTVSQPTVPAATTSEPAAPAVPAPATEAQPVVIDVPTPAPAPAPAPRPAPAPAPAAEATSRGS